MEKVEECRLACRPCQASSKGCESWEDKNFSGSATEMPWCVAVEEVPVSL